MFILYAWGLNISREWAAIYTQIILRVSIILILVATVMGAIGISLIGVSVYLTADLVEASDDLVAIPVDVSVQIGQTPESGQNRRRLATLTATPTPTPQAEKTAAVWGTVTPLPSATLPPAPTASPLPEETPPDVSLLRDPKNNDELEPTASKKPDHDRGDSLSIEISTPTLNPDSDVTVTSTASATGSGTSSAAALSVQADDDVDYVEPYTSTAQVQPPPSANAEPEAEFACPTESPATFDLIPIDGPPMSDHPDFLHGDLNLALRGYTPITESLRLEYYNGNTDPNAPRLHGLFEPNRVAKINHVYQINEWIWTADECGGTSRGCRGGAIDVFWPVTLVGLATTPGEFIYVPERGPKIHPGGYVALVLYAEEQRLTLGYTRRDNVAAGYIIHLESVCVDPNLLALYRAQRNADGYHTSGFLPALRNNQALGVALGGEIKVAVRDAGSFMDPRSDKDWWR